jgi:hypothetical protein
MAPGFSGRHFRRIGDPGAVLVSTRTDRRLLCPAGERPLLLARQQQRGARYRVPCNSVAARRQRRATWERRVPARRRSKRSRECTSMEAGPSCCSTSTNAVRRFRPATQSTPLSWTLAPPMQLVAHPAKLAGPTFAQLGQDQPPQEGSSVDDAGAKIQRPRDRTHTASATDCGPLPLRPKLSGRLRRPSSDARLGRPAEVPLGRSRCIRCIGTTCARDRRKLARRPLSR